MVADLPGVKEKIKEIASRHEYVRLNFVFEYPEALMEYDVPGFETTVVSFGTDIPRLKDELCLRRVLYGPGSILVAHGPDESIHVPELLASISGYQKLIFRFLDN